MRAASLRPIGSPNGASDGYWNKHREEIVPEMQQKNKKDGADAAEASSSVPSPKRGRFIEAVPRSIDDSARHALYVTNKH